MRSSSFLAAFVLSNVRLVLLGFSSLCGCSFVFLVWKGGIAAPSSPPKKPPVNCYFSGTISVVVIFQIDFLSFCCHSA
jgi:hypothetical protein